MASSPGLGRRGGYGAGRTTSKSWSSNGPRGGDGPMADVGVIPTRDVDRLRVAAETGSRQRAATVRRRSSSDSRKVWDGLSSDPQRGDVPGANALTVTAARVGGRG